MRKLLGVAVGLVLLSGCTTPPQGNHEEQVKQQAAVDAQQVRKDLKVAGRAAKEAVEQARIDTRAAVAGAREGWKAGAPKTDGSGDVDINHASLRDLETLPGIGGREARRIVAGRPYADVHALETQHIVSHAEYNRISGQVTAR